MHPDSAHFGASLPRELPHAVREVVSLAMVAIWVKNNQKWSHPSHLIFYPTDLVATLNRCMHFEV